MTDIYKFLKSNINVDVIRTMPNGQQVSFRSKLLEVLDDKLFLAEPKSLNFSFNDVVEYEKLTVVFSTSEGVLSGNVNFLRKNIENNGVYISFPYNNKFSQRRENTRIPMHVDFVLQLAEDQIYHLKTKNISGKGLACMTYEPLPEFSDTKIVLFMPSAQLNIFCRKVYSRPVEGMPEKIFLNGIEFLDIDEKSVAIIIKDCLKFQLESKHNERLFETL